MTPEEILEKNIEIYNLSETEQIVSKDSILEAMKEFGKLAFEAGRTIEDIDSIAEFMKYKEYEDFLKGLYENKD